ncbi:MAG: DUF262 domain-containing protein [Treponema sp.]|nr:DUF262 domain-containing protein [Treponema sp.]
MKGLTPAIIVAENKDKFYTIPIYQRLFEWDDEKIEQMLNDLCSTFEKNCNKPYYIGMLTSTEDDNLVDGQQRFTVMTLMGIVLRDYDSRWDGFLRFNNETRLRFAARDDDNSYLKKKIGIGDLKNDEKYCNKKMELGIQAIKNWLDNKEREAKSFDIKKFSKYVFENMTFFVSPLPKTYQGKDLNKYFESMNSTGRNLESHEIQKIDCLRGLDNNSNLTKEDATRIWNVVSQMDTAIIRKKSNNSKTETDKELPVHDRYESALNCMAEHNLDSACKLLNDFCTCKGEDNSDTIDSIKSSPEKPKNHTRKGSYHGMLSFSEFLLQVLFIQLNANDSISVNDFFDVHKLLDTFKDHTKKWHSDDWVKYFFNLLKYRLLLDYYVIRIPNEEDASFNLEFSDDVADNNSDKKKLQQYQSMLYAGSSSKSFYLWLNPYLVYLNKLWEKKIKITCLDLLNFLKEKDNIRNPKKIVEDLNYQTSPIYWFRRLDYYLWEKNCNSENDTNPLIDKFRFRRGGRSIEHLHPRNENEQDELWKEKSIHRFGNLALISSSFNSTQGNDPVGVKFARVEAQIKRGQLESIKLYKMYNLYEKNGKNWDRTLVERHEEEMDKILEESYKQRLDFHRELLV